MYKTNKMPTLQEKSASGAVATFNTALAMPLASCNIAVNAWQEGSGDPSPSNVRAIHGFSEVNVNANAVVHTIQLGQEVYGAEVDVVNGVAHCTHALENKSTSDFYTFDAHTGYPCSSAYIDASNDIKVLDVYNTQSIIDAGFMSNKLKTLYSTYVNSGAINSIRPYSPNSRRIYCFFDGSVITQASDISNVFGETIQIRYPLANPFDIQLTPTQIETIIGNNTIFADTGDIDLTYKDLDIAKRGNFREVFRLPS